MPVYCRHGSSRRASTSLRGGCDTGWVTPAIWLAISRTAPASSPRSVTWPAKNIQPTLTPPSAITARSRAGEQLGQRGQPLPEQLAPALGRGQGVDGRLVLVQHPENLVALGHDGHIAPEDLAARPRRARLGPGPADQRVDLAEVVLDQARDDVFLRLEMVVQGSLGDREPLGDLAQRRLLVTLLSEQLDCDLLDARPRVGAARCCLAHRPLRHASSLPGNLLDGRLVSSLPCSRRMLAGRQVG